MPTWMPSFDDRSPCFALAWVLCLAGCSKPASPPPPADVPETVFQAAARNDLPRLRALLAAGGDPNDATVVDDTSPLQKIGNFFRRKKQYDSTQQTPLQIAAERNHAAIVSALLAAGARPDVADGRGSRPLHLAAGAGALETVRVLAAAKDEVNALSRDGSTALMLAVSRNDERMVELLLGVGADPKVKTRSSGWTALHGASSHPAITRRLIAAGADVNALQDGRTPLTYAARAGALEVVRILLDAKADPNRGRPLESAKDEATQALLRSRGATVVSRP